jgi:putative zinc finger/helix-turn-helix YgiT family protein
MTKGKCPLCGAAKLHQETGDFTAQFENDEGQTRDVIVHDVTRSVCDSCGEYVLDEVAEDRISAAQRAAMGLLSASCLESFRKSLEKTQEEMSELLRLGKRTWCRWESNDHFQSASFDRYLRLLMFAPANISALEKIDIWKDGVESPSALADRFPFVRDVRIARDLGARFEAELRSGPFKAPKT